MSKTCRVGPQAGDPGKSGSWVVCHRTPSRSGRFSLCFMGLQLTGGGPPTLNGAVGFTQSPTNDLVGTLAQSG